MIKSKEANKIIEELLWTIEDYINLASSPKSYGTDCRYNRLEIHLIDSVGKQPGINVTELSRKHKITKSAVSQAVKKIESKGLMERYKSPENRKEVLFRLTEQGLTAFRAHDNFHKKVEAPFIQEIEGFTRKEADGVRKLIDLMNRRSALVRELEGEEQGEKHE